eukprot:COSAG02_NODE_550_length_20437_cov_4.270676_11_plen_99_part_00
MQCGGSDCSLSISPISTTSSTPKSLLVCTYRYETSSRAYNMRQPRKPGYHPTSYTVTWTARLVLAAFATLWAGLADAGSDLTSPDTAFTVTLVCTSQK